MFSTAFVDLAGDPRNFADRFGGEINADLLGPQQRPVLFDQIGPRFGEDANEIVLAERLKLNPDRQAALQFGQHVAGLGNVERARWR